MELKQDTATKNESIKRANDLVSNKMDKIKTVVNSFKDVSEIKIDEIRDKLNSNETRQKMKATASKEIDIARFIDDIEDCTTADMLYDVISEGLKLDKKDNKKRSAKNLNSVLNWLELDEEQQEILREKILNMDDSISEYLPSHFKQFTIRNYYNYFETEKWYFNLEFLINKLDSLESRGSSKSIDLTKAVSSVIKGTATSEQISLVNMTFPYNKAKMANSKITASYKAFLKKSLQSRVTGK